MRKFESRNNCPRTKKSKRTETSGLLFFLN